MNHSFKQTSPYDLKDHNANLLKLAAYARKNNYIYQMNPSIVDKIINNIKIFQSDGAIGKFIFFLIHPENNSYEYINTYDLVGNLNEK